MLATRTQRMAETAFAVVSNRRPNAQTSDAKKYRSFALGFPCLIHTAGLCQAVALAQADSGQGENVLADVVTTMQAVDSGTIVDLDSLAKLSREEGPIEYMRLTRLAVQAASLVKRYVEVLK